MVRHVITIVDHSNQPHTYFTVVRCVPFAVSSYMSSPKCPNGTMIGSVCQFSCQHGTKLIGSDEAVCEMDEAGLAEWIFSGQEPACEGKT